MVSKRDSWWVRMRRQYRLAVLDDRTLREVFHMRLSGMGTISVLVALFLVLIIVLSVLIVYTPIRNILPGYSESIRQQLLVESARIDSLQTNLAIQRQYLDVIKHVTAGDITTDSVGRLDSIEMVQRAQLLEQRNELTDAFLAQYEQSERDRMLLYDNVTNRSLRQFHRPVRGVVMQSVNADERQFSTVIRVAKNENVLSIMQGTIVFVEHEMEDNTFTMMVQHGSFLCVYRQVSTALKRPGTFVEAGESIGLMDGHSDLMIEIRDDGQFVDPEEVIVF